MSDGGYPTDEELDRIRQWPYTDLLGWFAYVRAVGNYWPNGGGWREHDGADDAFKKPQRSYRIATGGWSGNEDIIRAMEENLVCWISTWQSSHRGGLYIFSVPLTLAAEVPTEANGGVS